MDSIRVLVVEDDTHLLTGIRDILELEDYNVLTAANGRDGLTVLNADPANPPDVIVSDVMMPHMDGFEFLAEVRKENKWVNVPFIFLTAKGEKTDQHYGYDMGADRYLTKPFDAEDLLNAVSASLSRRRAVAKVADEEIKENKQKLLTIMNHEMRTPLTLVVAYAEMLKDFDPASTSPDEIMTFLTGVNSGADRLRRLIENFITVVDLDSGEAAKTIEWRNRPVQDLSFLTDDAVRQAENIVQTKRNYVVNIPDNLPTIEMDVQYMTIVLRELLDNGAKFSKEGETVTMTAHAGADHIVIEVKDAGRGIATHEINKIWEKFYQIEREKFEDQGSGSGLAIVKGIVELHGGSCSVESTFGEGSTFSVKLPLKVTVPEPQPIVEEASPETTS